MVVEHDELDLVLYISAATFLLPVSIFCKFVFLKLTKRKFNFTSGDILDITIFALATCLWVVVKHYETTDLKEPLFSPE